MPRLAAAFPRTTVTSLTLYTSSLAAAAAPRALHVNARAQYDECYSERIFQPHRQRKWWGPPRQRVTGADVGGKLGGALNDYACPGDAMNLWLNRSDVRTALHVPLDANFFSADNGNGFNYTLTEANILPLLYAYYMLTTRL